MAAAPPRLAAQQQTLTARERDEAARAAWRDEVATIDPADLICLDETSTHTALTRRRARAPRGEHAVGSVPRNHGPNVTLLATLTPTGSGPALAVAGRRIARSSRRSSSGAWCPACGRGR